MSAVLRRAVAIDAGALSDLAFRSKASNGYEADFMEACRDELAVTPAIIAEGGIWISEANSKPVGFFDIRLENDVLEVYSLYVDPDVKRSGVGRILWAALEERAVAMAAKAIKLDADPAAVKFYTAMGCSVIGQAPSGSIPGRMLPRMRKWL
ncbi:GNAT family N-acetyltransferase [Anderseniella sp. Alg231-50]|uniref:GNAT family N-acetyltransferase n=1 Tax=Anderseniella sp. Alg231-50 TaxID=1922226 RepID=UPI000D55675A